MVLTQQMQINRSLPLSVNRLFKNVGCTQIMRNKYWPKIVVVHVPELTASTPYNKVRDIGVCPITYYQDLGGWCEPIINKHLYSSIINI